MVRKKQAEHKEAERYEENPQDTGAAEADANGGPVHTETNQELDACRLQLIRLQADFDNYRKRMQKEQYRVYQDAVDGFVMHLLPVLDDLERAIRAAQAQAGDKNLLTGVEMTHRRLKTVLEKEGITAMECVGKPFDPDCHQAVQRVCVPDQPENTILEEAQRGYQRQDRIIRPAMVIVSTQEDE
jgi:molecular chaperone GrpE